MQQRPPPQPQPQPQQQQQSRPSSSSFQSSRKEENEEDVREEDTENVFRPVTAEERRQFHEMRHEISASESNRASQLTILEQLTKDTEKHMDKNSTIHDVEMDMLQQDESYKAARAEILLRQRLRKAAESMSADADIQDMDMESSVNENSYDSEEEEDKPLSPQEKGKIIIQSGQMALEDAVRSLTEDKQQLEKALSQKQDELNKVKANIYDERQRLDGTIGRLREERNKLRVQLNRLTEQQQQNSQQSMSNDAVAKMIDKAIAEKEKEKQQQLAKLQQDRDELKSKLDAKDREVMQAQFNQQLQHQQELSAKDREMLEAKLSMQMEKDQLRSLLEKQLADKNLEMVRVQSQLQQELDQLKSSLQEHRANKDQQINTEQALVKTKIDMKDLEIKHARELVQDRDKRIEELQKQKSGLESELNSIRDSLSAAERDLAVCQKEKEVLQEKLDDFSEVREESLQFTSEQIGGTDKRPYDARGGTKEARGYQKKRIEEFLQMVADQSAGLEGDEFVNKIAECWQKEATKLAVGKEWMQTCRRVFGYCISLCDNKKVKPFESYYDKKRGIRVYRLKKSVIIMFTDHLMRPSTRSGKDLAHSTLLKMLCALRRGCQFAGIQIPDSNMKDIYAKIHARKLGAHIVSAEFSSLYDLYQILCTVDYSSPFQVRFATLTVVKFVSGLRIPSLRMVALEHLKTLYPDMLEAFTTDLAFEATVTHEKSYDMLRPRGQKWSHSSDVPCMSPVLHILLFLEMRGALVKETAVEAIRTRDFSIRPEFQKRPLFPNNKLLTEEIAAAQKRRYGTDGRAAPSAAQAAAYKSSLRQALDKAVADAAKKNEEQSNRGASQGTQSAPSLMDDIDADVTMQEQDPVTPQRPQRSHSSFAGSPMVDSPPGSITFVSANMRSIQVQLDEQVAAPERSETSSPNSRTMPSTVDRRLYSSTRSNSSIVPQGSLGQQDGHPVSPNASGFTPASKRQRQSVSSGDTASASSMDHDEQTMSMEEEEYVTERLPSASSRTVGDAATTFSDDHFSQESTDESGEYEFCLEDSWNYHSYYLLLVRMCSMAGIKVPLTVHSLRKGPFTNALILYICRNNKRPDQMFMDALLTYFGWTFSENSPQFRRYWSDSILSRWIDSSIDITGSREPTQFSLQMVPSMWLLIRPDLEDLFKKGRIATPVVTDPTATASFVEQPFPNTLMHRVVAGSLDYRTKKTITMESFQALHQSSVGRIVLRWFRAFTQGLQLPAGITNQELRGIAIALDVHFTRYALFDFLQDALFESGLSSGETRRTVFLGGVGDLVVTPMDNVYMASREPPVSIPALRAITTTQWFSPLKDPITINATSDVIPNVDPDQQRSTPGAKRTLTRAPPTLVALQQKAHDVDALRLQLSVTSFDDLAPIAKHLFGRSFESCGRQVPVKETRDVIHKMLILQHQQQDKSDFVAKVVQHVKEIQHQKGRLAKDRKTNNKQQTPKGLAAVPIFAQYSESFSKFIHDYVVPNRPIEIVAPMVGSIPPPRSTSLALEAVATPVVRVPVVSAPVAPTNAAMPRSTSSAPAQIVQRRTRQVSAAQGGTSTTRPAARQESRQDELQRRQQFFANQRQQLLLYMRSHPAGALLSAIHLEFAVEPGTPEEVIFRDEVLFKVCRFDYSRYDRAVGFICILK